jgi:hypothetical protein
MISFRYHVVTIVAVLVALAAGVLLGGTFLDTALANQLNRQVAQLRGELEQAQGQSTDAQQQLSRSAQFQTIWLPSLLSDRLTGISTVLVTIEGVDLSALQAARQSLVQAGVTDLETIQLKAKMGSADPADRAALAQTLGLSGPPPANLSVLAMQALAERLLTTPAPGASDLLVEWKTEGFIQSVGPAGVTGIGVPGQTVGVVAGGPAPASIDPASFLMPLISSLVQRDPVTPVSAGEPATTEYPFVSLIRTSDVNGKLVTVDDVDTVFGQLSFAIGLQDLVADPGHGANYGEGPGASAPFPAP